MVLLTVVRTGSRVSHHSRQPIKTRSAANQKRITPHRCMNLVLNHVAVILLVHVHWTYHTRMLLRIVRKLRSGVGVASESTRPSDLAVLRAGAVPGRFSEDDFRGVVWREGGLPSLRDWCGIEAVLAAEATNAKALDPCTLADAKRCLDPVLWERTEKERWLPQDVRT